MYVCLCMSMYVYVCLCMSMYVYVCLCMEVCMYVSMYVCMYACMYVCMHGCMYVCKYVCMYACMYVCMDVCMYVYMHACIYTYLKQNEIVFLLLTVCVASLFCATRDGFKSWIRQNGSKNGWHNGTTRNDDSSSWVPPPCPAGADRQPGQPGLAMAGNLPSRWLGADFSIRNGKIYQW